MPGSFRNYGKIDPYVQFQNENKRKARRRIFIIVASSVFLVVALVCIVVGVTISNHRRSSDSSNSSVDNPQYSTGSNAIQAACNTTLYPDTCRQTLSSYPGSLTANPLQLVKIAAEVAVKAVTDAYNYSLSVAQEDGLSPLEVMAAQDCEELMDAALEELNVSIFKLSSLDISSLKSGLEEIEVFLSSASSDQTACEDSLYNLTGSSVPIMLSKQEFVSEVILNALCLVETLSSLGSDLSSWKNALPSLPDIFHFRRRLLSAGSSVGDRFDQGASFSSDTAGYPNWLSAGDRKLLQAPTSSIGADITVDQLGSGQYTTLKQALKDVPEDRSERIVIYVKQGTYEEGPLNISKAWVNLTLIGDGCNKTIITGSANVAGGQYTTYRSATVGIAAKGFIAKDITFRNTAGPNGSQAVAMRANAEEFVFDSCCFEGHQDTLYALSGKQFYTNCKILGTVDFIFGNALAVFQNCELVARLPISGQQNTYTAQGKKQAQMVTGFSFQLCSLTEGDDLIASPFAVSTYLGRPWKAYSTVVYMQSTIGSHVNSDGWLPWNASNPFETSCYYAEYDNYGNGSDVSKRVPWQCVHPSISADDASKFTVDNFLSGTTWIPTDVQYTSGLNS